MYPEIFNFNLPFNLPIIGNNIVIHTYGVMVAIGFILGYSLIIYRSKIYNVDTKKTGDLIFYSVILGIIGARIFYVIINWDYYFSNPFEIFKIWNGGIVFYGGAITGLLSGIFICKIFKLKIPVMLDIAVPGLSLGHFFGRIGCFSYGCCFGKTCSTESFYTVKFPAPAPAYEKHLSSGLIDTHSHFSLPVLNTQLISALFLLLLTLFLIIYDKKIRKHSGSGTLFALYLIIYSVFRFIIEFYRDEFSEFYILTNFTVSQFISVILFIIGFILLYKFKASDKK
jgi:phosphatidylglycerol:prolipoprotein diacylglycerol transferase